MNRFGFFLELRGNGPSLNDARKGEVDLRCFAYFQGAPVAVAVPGFIRDPENQSKPLCSAHVRTDGLWLWPEELPLLIRRYGLALPEPLIQRIEENGWAPPMLSREDLLRVEQEITGAQALEFQREP